ncbi:MAG: hypothetical protein J1E81_06830 [Eubacterium sp.]|nr:hypothetical protein [Eubacterium sp.]
MNKNKLLAVMLAATMVCTTGMMAACGDGNKDDDKKPAGSSGYSMDITEQVSSWKKTTKNNATYYSAEGVVYCEKPTTKAKQALNIYVPAEYMNDDGSINSSGTRNGYTAETAPILYINSVGAYQGKVPYKITDATETLAMKQGWYFDYINQGFVLAFAGARGRSDYDSNSVALGKAPVGLSDLKAGIRFLKHNGDKLPGDTDKIISSGMSAGGAMSMLIATSGNSSEFDSYLQAMGAVMDETDDVYAAQAYCPITDLDYADFAYEWMFKNDNNNTANGLSAFQKALSANFYNEYISYFNSKNIKVGEVTYQLGSDGRSGTFYDWLLEQYAISYRVNAGENATLPSYLSSLDSIVTNHNHRSKVCPTFDSLDISTTASASSENGVFGNPAASLKDADFQRHFCVGVTEQIKALESQFPTEYAKYYEAYKAQSDLAEVKKQVELYNPYTYLYAGNTDVAQKIRICVGSADSDTSIAVTGQLTLTLRSLGIDTEYAIMWGQGHTDADLAGAYEAWVNSISK